MVVFSLRSIDDHFAVVSYARMDPAGLGERPDAGRLRARLRKMVAKKPREISGIPRRMDMVT
jgi:hypothetical protein